MIKPEGLVGKVILVGLTYMDHEDQVYKRDTFYGPVLAVSESTVVVRRSDSGAEFSIPNDNLQPADPEYIYTLRSGEEVAGVYATSTWTIWPPKEQ